MAGYDDTIQSLGAPGAPRVNTLERETPTTADEVWQEAAHLAAARESELQFSREPDEKAAKEAVATMDRATQIKTSPPVAMGMLNPLEPRVNAAGDGWAIPIRDQLLGKANELADSVYKKYEGMELPEQLLSLYEAGKDLSKKQVVGSGEEFKKDVDSVRKPWIETMAEYVGPRDALKAAPVVAIPKAAYEYIVEDETPEIASDVISAYRDFSGDKDVQKLLKVSGGDKDTSPVFPGMWDVAQRAMMSGFGESTPGAATPIAMWFDALGSTYSKASAVAKAFDHPSFAEDMEWSAKMSKDLANDFRSLDPKEDVGPVISKVREWGDKPLTPEHIDDLTTSISGLNYNELGRIGHDLQEPDLQTFVDMAALDKSLPVSGPLTPIYSAIKDGDLETAQEIANSLPLGLWPSTVRAQVFGKKSEKEFLDSVVSNIRNAVKNIDDTGGEAGRSFDNIFKAVMAPDEDVKGPGVENTSGEVQFYESDLYRAFRLAGIAQNAVLEADVPITPGGLFVKSLNLSEMSGRFLPDQVADFIKTANALRVPTPRGIEVMMASREMQPLLRAMGLKSDPRFSLDSSWHQRDSASTAAGYTSTYRDVATKSDLVERGSAGADMLDVFDTLMAVAVPYEGIALAPLSTATGTLSKGFRAWRNPIVNTPEGKLAYAVAGISPHVGSMLFDVGVDPHAAMGAASRYSTEKLISRGENPIESLSEKAVKNIRESARSMGFDDDAMLDYVRAHVSAARDRMDDLVGTLSAGTSDIRAMRELPEYGPWMAALKSAMKEAGTPDPLIAVIASKAEHDLAARSYMDKRSVSDLIRDGKVELPDPAAIDAIEAFLRSGDLGPLFDADGAGLRYLAGDDALEAMTWNKARMEDIPARVSEYLRTGRPDSAATRIIGDNLRERLSDIWLRAYGHGVESIDENVKTALDAWLRPDAEYLARTTVDYAGEPLARTTISDVDTKQSSIERVFEDDTLFEAGPDGSWIRKGQVDPIKLFLGLVEHTAAENARSIISTPTKRITLRTVVPESRVKSVQGKVNQTIRDWTGLDSKTLAKKTNKDGTITLDPAESGGLAGLLRQLEPQAVGAFLPGHLFNPGYDLSRISAKDWREIHDVLVDYHAGPASGRHLNEYSAGSGLAQNLLGTLTDIAKNVPVLKDLANTVTRSYIARMPYDGAVNRAQADVLKRFTKQLDSIGRDFATIAQDLNKAMGRVGETVVVRDILAKIVADTRPAIALNRVQGLYDSLFKEMLDESYDIAHVRRRNSAEAFSLLLARGLPDPSDLEMKAIGFLEASRTRLDELSAQVARVEATESLQSKKSKALADDEAGKRGATVRLRDAASELYYEPQAINGASTKAELEALKAQIADATHVLMQGGARRWQAVEHTALEIAKRISGGQDGEYGKKQLLTIYKSFFDGDFDTLVKTVLSETKQLDVEDMGNRIISATMAVQARNIMNQMAVELAASGLNIRPETLHQNVAFGGLGNASRSGFVDDVVRTITIELGGVANVDMAATDISAYAKAMEILSDYGFQPNTNGWQRVIMSDGSEAIMPKEMAEFLSEMVGRVAPAKADVSDLEDFLVGNRLGNADIAGLKDRAPTTAGEAVTQLMMMLPITPAFIKQNKTTGTTIPHIGYFVNQVVGAAVQNWMAMGYNGLASVFREPRMSTAVSARLWGRAKTVEIDAPPIITDDMQVLTTEMLTEMVERSGLRSSYLQAETLKSVARDIRHNVTKSTAARLMEVPETWRTLLTEASTAIDNNFRVGIFIDELKRGASEVEAAEMARKAQFDYSEMSDVAKKHFRDTILFYSYTHNMLKLFWDTLLTEPHRVMGQLRLVKGLQEHYLDDDASVVMSEYMQGKLPLLVVKNAENAAINRGYMFTTTPLPAIDTYNLMQGLFAIPPMLAGEPASGEAVGEQLVSRVMPMHIGGSVPSMMMSFVTHGYITMGMGEEIFSGVSVDYNEIPQFLMNLDLALFNGTMKDLFGTTMATANKPSEMERVDSYTKWVPAPGAGARLWWFFSQPYSRDVQDMVKLDRANVGITEGMNKALIAYAKEVNPESYERMVKVDTADPRPGLGKPGEVSWLELAGLAFPSYSVPYRTQTEAKLLDQKRRENESARKAIQKKLDTEIK